MEQSQAQRTLVKSPPELWAELSSEDSLGRHLAEFGEIRITRVKPENTVAWEGDRASGTVQIEPTGWGTKVTLTAEPVVAEPVVEPEPEPVAEPEAVVEPAPVMEPEPPTEPQPVVSVTRISLREVDSPAQPAAGDDPVARGFFTRFFRRPAAPHDLAPPAIRASIPTPPAPTPDPSPPTPAPDPAPSPPPAPDPAPDPAPPAPGPAPTPPPSIEMPQPAPLDPERTTAILSEVLDDLGAAHHRPFSRG